MLWVYTYEIVPRQRKDHLDAIQALLDHEHTDARRGARTWAGRLVVEGQVMHILVVSDSPDQASAINRRIEAELATLEADFSVTVPMPVADHTTEVPDAETPGAGSDP